ncbi:hypothetical protein C0J52_08706 [Blattella germanica]|nr:hypothetical protein C0J52_08706 [Blattella germanica]
MEVAELLNRLESNQPEIVEESKKTFHETFLRTKESWLVNGLVDYYFQTSSTRSIEILVGVREPHDKHLFDRLSDSLKSSARLQTLTLLGHIVRRHPAWIYKIAQHTLLKELLKLLKAEIDILPLMSALLVLIVLLPMIPALIGSYLQDIFEVFSRLAAWNTNNPNKLPEDHLLHLQPMLDTVKMHPLLVTASKEAETGTARWKKMEHHDVILECAKFALDNHDRARDEASYQDLPPTKWPRYSLEHSSLESTFQHQMKGNPTLNLMAEKENFSPSLYCGMSTPPPQESVPTSIPQTPNSQSYIGSSSLPHQEGTSPPEAAIEATPETTPIKDLRHMARVPQLNSSVARALNSFSSSKWGGVTSGSSTPTQSQPSSPMKKEPSPFRFPPDGSNSSKSAFEQPRRDSLHSILERRDSLFSQKIQRVHQDRIQVSDAFANDKQTPPILLRSKTPAGQPTSPLRTIASETGIPNSPVPMEPTAPVPGAREWVVAKPMPEKNGFRFDSVETSAVPSHTESSQEDQEVLAIVSQGEQWSIDTQPKQVIVQATSQRQCDSVLQEIHPAHVDDYEECEQESGSTCTSGGLHMATSRSMREFAHRVIHHHRERFYSQCTPDTRGSTMSDFSTGSSPGEGSAFPLQVRVRRANSCPEMKKGPALPGAEANIDKTLEEKEELEESETVLISDGAESDQSNAVVNGRTGDKDQLLQEPVITAKDVVLKQLATSSTQTVDHWSPLPYEHLFLGAFPPVEQQSQNQNGEVKPSTAPRGHLETELKTVKEQLTLLSIQLQFERHRREAHAERNRRLLGKSRTNRALEEYNSALSTTLQKENKELRGKNELLQQELKQAKERTATVTKEFQQVESMLFEVGNEMQQAIAQASAGERLRGDMEQLQKELILMGELQQKYRDRFSQLPLLRHHEDEVALLQDSYCEEIKGITEMLESRNSALEASKARNSELESVVTRRDMIIADQKRVLKQVKEEYHEKLQSVESKYQTQRSITQRMESHILELYQRIELAEYASKRKSTRSPDSSGAHEVSVGSAGSADKPVGPSSFSPHSSPLSESLGSAEGSLSGILGGEGVEMKNLQVIVDQPEPLASALPSGEQQPGASQHSAEADTTPSGGSSPEAES